MFKSNTFKNVYDTLIDVRTHTHAQIHEAKEKLKIC